MESGFFARFFGQLSAQAEDTFCFANRVLEKIGDRFDPRPDDPRLEEVAVEAAVEEPDNGGGFGLDCNDNKQEAVVDTFEFA